MPNYFFDSNVSVNTATYINAIYSKYRKIILVKPIRFSGSLLSVRPIINKIVAMVASSNFFIFLHLGCKDNEKN